MGSAVLATTRMKSPSSPRRSTASSMIRPSPAASPSRDAVTPPPAVAVSCAAFVSLWRGSTGCPEHATSQRDARHSVNTALMTSSLTSRQVYRAASAAPRGGRYPSSLHHDVSHQLRPSLTSIEGYAWMLREWGLDDPGRRGDHPSGVAALEEAGRRPPLPGRPRPEAVGASEVAEAASQHNGWVRLEVSDTGIPEGHLAHVFERFYRDDESRVTRGAGLGLSIACQIAEAHGGSRARWGEQSTFTLQLPKDGPADPEA